MPDTDKILAAIGSTEATTFSEFCHAYADCPEKGEREAWRELFDALRELERDGLAEVERAGRNIQSLMLTDAGADRVRGKLDAGRGLFQERDERF